MEKGKLLNYAIWTAILGGGGYFLYKWYKTTSTYKKSLFESVKKKHPNWEVGNRNETYGNAFIPYKSNGELGEPLILLYHISGGFVIYSIDEAGKLKQNIAGGKVHSPNKLKVTTGLNKGLVATGSTKEILEKIMGGKVFYQEKY